MINKSSTSKNRYIRESDLEKRVRYKSSMTKKKKEEKEMENKGYNNN